MSRRESNPCPDCRGPSFITIYTRAEDGYEHQYAEYCDPCSKERRRRIDAYRTDLDHHLPYLTLRTRNCLGRAFNEVTFDIHVLLAMTDDQLLCLRNFGKVALAEFRSFVPNPIPAPPPPPPDPAIFWAQRHDVFQIVGG